VLDLMTLRLEKVKERIVEIPCRVQHWIELTEGADQLCLWLWLLGKTSLGKSVRHKATGA